MRILFYFTVFIICGSAMANPFEKLQSQIEALRSEVKNSIPVGTILPFSSEKTIPAGFLFCDGRALSLKDPKYKQLFAVIGFAFTPSDEQERGLFRLPDLRGRTIVGAVTRTEELGTQEDGSPLTMRCIGSSFGKECHTLTIDQLPRHTHGGKTGDPDRGHTHAGVTDEDFPDHTHVSHSRSSNPNSPHKFQGFGMDVHSNQGFSNFKTEGASTRHKHEFRTHDQSNGHVHEFETDGGKDLKPVPNGFSLSSPSLIVPYIIKVK